MTLLSKRHSSRGFSSIILEKISRGGGQHESKRRWKRQHEKGVRAFDAPKQLLVGEQPVRDKKPPQPSLVRNTTHKMSKQALRLATAIWWLAICLY